MQGKEGEGRCRCSRRSPVGDTHVHPSPAGHGPAYSGVSPVSLVETTSLRILHIPGGTPNIKTPLVTPPSVVKNRVSDG